MHNRRRSTLTLLLLLVSLAACQPSADDASPAAPAGPNLTLHGKSARKLTLDPRLSAPQSLKYVKGTTDERGRCQITPPDGPPGTVGLFVEIDMGACEGIAGYSARWREELERGQTPVDLPQQKPAGR